MKRIIINAIVPTKGGPTKGLPTKGATPTKRDLPKGRAPTKGLGRIPDQGCHTAQGQGDEWRGGATNV